MKAMLFAAGLGTRLKPFTDSNPKALALVNGKPLLQRNIEYLKSYGINNFVINVFHFAEKIIDFLEANNNFGCTIEIIDERPNLLETGGGLVNAKSNFDEDFLVMNVDILTDLNVRELINYHNKNKSLVTLAVSDRKSSRKLFFDKNNRLQGWKNYTTDEEISVSDNLNFLTPLAFSGIHVISQEIFELITQSGKFSIMKTYMELMSSYTIKGFNHSGGILIDVGRIESVREAEIYFK